MVMVSLRSIQVVCLVALASISASLASISRTVFVFRHCLRSTPFTVNGAKGFDNLNNYSAQPFPDWGVPVFQVRRASRHRASCGNCNSSFDSRPSTFSSPLFSFLLSSPLFSFLLSSLLLSPLLSFPFSSPLFSFLLSSPLLSTPLLSRSTEYCSVSRKALRSSSTWAPS